MDPTTAELLFMGTECETSGVEAFNTVRDMENLDAEAAVDGAEAVLLCTEWEQYVRLDPARIGELVSERVVVDGRNALDPDAWKRAGWEYRGVGRR